MARESKDQKRRRAAAILNELKELYPGAKTALEHRNAFELLIATILSAQCTDERVNKVTPRLFEAAPDPEAVIALGEKKIRSLISSINFFNNKAKNIIACCTKLRDEHSSQVPDSLDELVGLAGVGRKTANVVLGDAFGKAEGVVVDTHVFRLSQRLGLSRAPTVEKVEQELNGLVDRKDWTLVSHVLILHGRARCKARRPDCLNCEISRLCPSARHLAKAEL
jgi:endonuclease-3